MRNLIYAINITMDGCCDHTKVTGDEEVHTYFTRLMQDVDLLLYGRETYQLMVPFWPDVAKDTTGHNEAMNEFALAFNAINKIVVFSQSLEAAADNTTIARSINKDEILTWKQQPGKSIATGGVSIPSQLLALDLIDEIRIVIHPVVVGEGRRLSAHLQLIESLSFKLTESRTFNSGCIALHYLRQ